MALKIKRTITLHAMTYTKKLAECVEKESNKKQQHEDDINTETTKQLAVMDL